LSPFAERFAAGHVSCSCCDAAACERQELINRCGDGLCQHANQPTIDPVEGFMLRYAVIFFIIAIIAAFFGFGGIASGAAEIAKILFFIFIVIFLATLLLGVFRR
jgi:uncharacterized membrane protein YtjA (UPF0391 family)